MNVTLLKALLALVPMGLLFSGSVVLISRGKTVWSFLQLIGAACLVIVALTHLFEALECSLGCTGSLRIAWGIISIYLAPFSASRCFRQGICFMRWQRNTRNDWRVTLDGQATP